MTYRIHLQAYAPNWSPTDLPSAFEGSIAKLQVHADGQSVPDPARPPWERQAAYFQSLETVYDEALAANEVPSDWVKVAFPIPSVADPEKPRWRRTDGTSMRLVNEGDTTGVRVFVSIYVEGARPQTFEYIREIENDSGREAFGVSLVFGHTRGVPPAVVGSEPESGSRQEGQPDSASELLKHLSFRKPLRHGGKLELTVKGAGDPPHLSGVAWWLTDEPTQKIPLFTSMTVFGYVQFGEDAPAEEEVRRHLILLDDEFHERNKRVEDQNDDDLRSCGRFFADLDKTTFPTRAGRLESVVTGAGVFLDGRLWERGELAGFGRSPKLHYDELRMQAEHAARIAGVFEGLMRAHLGDDRGSIDESRVERAFELFAGGALPAFRAHGVPNGVNYFLFTEFTLLLKDLERLNEAIRGGLADGPEVDLGHDPRLWDRIRPAIARSAEIFARAFHGPDGKRSREHYRPEFNAEGRRSFDENDCAKLKQDWAGDDVAMRFGRVVFAALKDEYESATVATEAPYPLPRKPARRDVEIS